MPHQCTDCRRTFADGSKEMLSGCPDCGGTKFQYRPEGTSDQSAQQIQSEPPEPPEPAFDSSVARTVGNAATTVRDLVGSQSKRESKPQNARTGDVNPREDNAQAGAREDNAQASARSEVISPDELPPAPDRFKAAASMDVDTSATSEPARAPETEAVASEARETDSTVDSPSDPAADEQQDDSARDARPDLAELRAELNDQFESIRVVEPGQYELNLMELFDREEYIIALQEDGKYTIQVPERWND